MAVSYFGDRDGWNDHQREQRRVEVTGVNVALDSSSIGAGAPTKHTDSFFRRMLLSCFSAAGTNVIVERTKTAPRTILGFYRSIFPSSYVTLRAAPTSRLYTLYRVPASQAVVQEFGGAIHRRPRSEPLPCAIHYPTATPSKPGELGGYAFSGMELQILLPRLPFGSLSSWTFFPRHRPFSNDTYSASLDFVRPWLPCIVFLHALCGRWRETAASWTDRLEQAGLKDGLAGRRGRMDVRVFYGIFPSHTFKTKA
ncbi:hypothetical protein ARMSODRAFT_1022764 [Armillaria solidipes]|uniref:Uncharacterized protein n=1 Tax=Armillaria solidipes TaxID=1076256 RepID=A0A2H3BNZ0_9AGAR|nr:hypothetical protein ARMSODRAFT_1022764 [Armillaria solidipes]